MQEIQFGYATQAGIHWLTGAESTGQSVLRHVLGTGVARSGFFRLFSTPGWVVARGWVMPWQTSPIEAELYLSATPTGMTIHMARIINDEVRTYTVYPAGSRTVSDCDRSPFEWDDDAATELVVSYFRNGGRLDEAMCSSTSGSPCGGARDCRQLSRRAPALVHHPKCGDDRWQQDPISVSRAAFGEVDGEVFAGPAQDRYE